jgi:hypothetical protein
MLQRPTASKIASAYTGNAPALDARIKQEQQADNSISPDLRKLLALQDLTSDEKHMGIDQALKTPMNPPTVAQSLQDRAKQILAARMTQAQQNAGIAQDQQQQMVDQARPGPVPQGVQQPEQQPEGIDQLTSNVGDAYANGGIVAFSSGGYGEWLRSMFESNITDAEKKRKAALEAAAQPAAKEASAKQAAISKRLDEERARNYAEVINPKPEGDPRLLRAPKGESVSTAAEDAETVKTQAPAPKPPRITKITDKPSIANLPTLPPELPIPVAGSPRDIMGKSMTLDPDAEAKRILAAREKLVGAPDTSQYQALIDELRGQKTKLQEKKEPGFESLMDYLGEIAAGPTTGRSGKAGSQASERLRLRGLEKEKQANALSERMIEAAQKQQDAIYGYKKEGFALSEGERSRVFKERFDSAKAAGESDDRARQMAQNAVLEREKMAVERERIAATLKSAGMNRQGQLMDIAEALMKQDKTGKLDLPAALQKAALLIGSTQIAGQDVRSRADYQKAKDKITEQNPEWMRVGDTKSAVAARRSFEKAMAELDQTYGVTGGAGLNSLPATNAGVKILSIEPSKP